MAKRFFLYLESLISVWGGYFGQVYVQMKCGNWFWEEGLPSLIKFSHARILENILNSANKHVQFRYHLLPKNGCGSTLQSLIRTMQLFCSTFTSYWFEGKLMWPFIWTGLLSLVTLSLICSDAQDKNRWSLQPLHTCMRAVLISKVHMSYDYKILSYFQDVSMFSPYYIKTRCNTTLTVDLVAPKYIIA